MFSGERTMYVVMGRGWVALLFPLLVGGLRAPGQEVNRWDGGRLLQDWLKVSGEMRARYETLDGQFREGGAGGDQLLLFRTLLHMEAELGWGGLGLELQDSRTYLGDEGSPVSSSFTNAVDVLQIYGRFELPGLLGRGSNTQLMLGRQTVSIGSKRQIERVSYANVIKSYTGGHLVSKNGRGDELHLLAVVPVGRLPSGFEGVMDNNVEADREEWHRQIWGIHYRRADVVPVWVDDLWGEAFLYGLHEEDRGGSETPNRNYVAPGFRVYRKPERGRWDCDIEGVLRMGSRRATDEPGDKEDLDVFATMFFGAVGYTFDLPWEPRLALEYYWASGDEDPNDGRFDQYERLFGSRRTDLNNTSIHGPLTPANLSAPGVRLEVRPNERMDARVAYSAAFLASKRDEWVIADLRDESGSSGSFLGHAVDGRMRYWLEEERLSWELGASIFWHGGFSEEVPGGPDPGMTLLGYTSLSLYF